MIEFYISFFSLLKFKFLVIIYDNFNPDFITIIKQYGRRPYGREYDAINLPCSIDAGGIFHQSHVFLVLVIIRKLGTLQRHQAVKDLFALEHREVCSRHIVVEFSKSLGHICQLLLRIFLCVQPMPKILLSSGAREFLFNE